MKLRRAGGGGLVESKIHFIFLNFLFSQRLSGQLYAWAAGKGSWYLLKQQGVVHQQNSTCYGAVFMFFI